MHRRQIHKLRDSPQNTPTLSPFCLAPKSPLWISHCTHAMIIYELGNLLHSSGAYAMKESGLGSFAIYSDDHGKTWKRSEPAGDKSSDMCQITPLGYQEHREQLLMMTSKTPHGHFFVYSNDSGHTWSNLSMPSSLNPQTDCEGSLLSIPYEGVYMNTHLYTTQPHSVHHQNLTFFHSVDGGKVWKSDFLLWNGPSAYSSLTYDSDRFKVLCLFECGTNAYTEKLTLAIFSPLI